MTGDNTKNDEEPAVHDKPGFFAQSIASALLLVLLAAAMIGIVKLFEGWVAVVVLLVFIAVFSTAIDRIPKK